MLMPFARYAPRPRRALALAAAATDTARYAAGEKKGRAAEKHDE